jgi:hypothetical protein
VSMSAVEEIVNVPVPVGALPLVHELLNRYYQSRSESTVERVAVPGNGDWSREDIAALHERLRRPALRAIMRCLAENPDRKVAYKELATAADVSHHQLRAHLAWLSKYSAAVKETNVWPIVVTEESSLPEGERCWYSMNKAIARWWLAEDREARKVDRHESVL